MSKNIKLSYFNGYFSKKPLDSTLEKFIDTIKNNPNANEIEAARNAGKHGNDKVKVFRYGKSITTNLYGLTKERQPVYMLQVLVEGGKTKEHVVGYTGLIYIDIDNFDSLRKKYAGEFEAQTGVKLTQQEQMDKYPNAFLLEEAYSILKANPYVMSLWKSFGGNGLGGIVLSEGLDSDSFNPTWQAFAAELAKTGLVLDPATKNNNRTTVVSHDPDMWENPNPISFEPVKEIGLNEDKKHYVVQNMQELPRITNDVAEELLMNLILKLQNNEDLLNHEEEKYHHNFYFLYFVNANSFGIRKEDAIQFFLESQKGNNYAVNNTNRTPEVIAHKAEGVYKTYAKEFGKKSIYNPNNRFTKVFVTRKYKRHELSNVCYFAMAMAENRFGYIHKTATHFDKQKDMLIIREAMRYCRMYGVTANQFYHWYQTVYAQDFPMKIENNAAFEAQYEKMAGKTLQKFHLIPTDAVLAYSLKVRHTIKEPFSVEFNTTKEYIDLARALFVDDLKKNGSVVRVMDSNPHKAAKLKKMMFKALASVPIILDTEIHMAYPVIIGFIKGLLKQAVFFQDIEDFINSEPFLTKLNYIFRTEKFEGVDETEYVERCLMELQKMFLYVLAQLKTEQAYREGVYHYKKMTLSELEERFNIKQKIVLPNHQKLAHVVEDMNYYKDFMLWAAPGMGKTTWVCEYLEGKRIILVPVVGSLQSIASKYPEASVFYEKEKNVKEGDELIVCTYSSFPTLMGIMEEWKKSPIREYVLVFDEDHNFAASAAKNYRGHELRAIVTNYPKFKRFIRLTGTPYPLAHETLAAMPVVKVEWQLPIEKEYYDVYYQDIHAAIAENLVKGKRNIIFCQSKKMTGDLGKLTTFLQDRGFTVSTINADVKDTQRYQDLIVKETLEQADVTICTSVMSEALNIQDMDCETVHFYTFTNHINAEQLVHRFRQVLPKRAYFYRPATQDALPLSGREFNTMNLQFGMVEQAKKMEQLIGNSNKEEKELTRLSSYHLPNLQSLLITTNVNGYKETLVDYLAISNSALVTEEKFEYANPDYMEVNLALYGWVKKGEIQQMEVKTNEEKTSIATFIAEEKTKMGETVAEIMETVKNVGISALNKYGDDVKPTDSTEQLEIKLHSKIKTLMKHMDFPAAVQQVKDFTLEHSSLNDRSWNQKFGTILVSKARRKGLFEEDLYANPAYQKLAQAFSKTPKTIYTQTTLAAWANKFWKHSPTYIKDLTFDGAMSVLSKIFEVKPVLVSHAYKKRGIGLVEQQGELQYVELTPQDFNLLESKKDVRYIIKGLLLTQDIRSFSKRFIEWIEDKHTNGKFFSSEELMDTIMDLRKTCPILNRYTKLGKQALFNIAHQYMEFEVGTTRKEKVDGVMKAFKYYKVTACFPTNLATVEWVGDDVIEIDFQQIID